MTEMGKVPTCRGSMMGAITKFGYAPVMKVDAIPELRLKNDP